MINADNIAPTQTLRDILGDFQPDENGGLDMKTITPVRPGNWKARSVSMLDFIMFAQQVQDAGYRPDRLAAFVARFDNDDPESHPAEMYGVIIPEGQTESNVTPDLEIVPLTI